MASIDINCDLGEGFDNDALLMPFISSANIACGFHAGDEQTMKSTIALAKMQGVAVGAHPGFADKTNFGRTELQLSPADYYEVVKQQLIIFKRISDQFAMPVHHVKVHGALYNMAVSNRVIAYSVAKAVYDFDPSLIFYGLANSIMLVEAAQLGLRIASEVFADRTYQENGNLTPRSEKNALLTEVKSVEEQALMMVTQKKVMATNGKEIQMVADTICIHGDGHQAIAFAKSIHHALKEKGIEIKSL